MKKIQTYGKQNLFNQVKIAVKEKFTFTKSMRLAQKVHGYEIYKTKPIYFNMIVAGALILAILSSPIKYLSVIKVFSQKITNLLLWGLR